jgi:Protein of unknown function (DUF992)
LRHKGKIMKTKLAAAGLVAALAVAVPGANAAAPVRVGLLTCQVDGAVGKILGSYRKLSCTFEHAKAQPLEFYQGQITRYGLDVGRTQYSDIAWAVLALASPYSPGALAGTYAGLSAGVSIGVGLGANVLVGGLDRSFALQPVSIEASRGFNLALGIGKLELISTPGYGGTN